MSLHSEFTLGVNHISCLCFQHNCPLPPVCEVVQTLQLCSDKDPQDVVGDLSICLDGMQVDPETFATAEREHGKEPQGQINLMNRMKLTSVIVTLAWLILTHI